MDAAVKGECEAEKEQNGEVAGVEGPLSKSQKRRQRLKRYKAARKREGDLGKRRETGKEKKGGRPSKRAKKKSNSRTQKLQKKLNSKSGKIVTMRRENVELRRQQRRTGSGNTHRGGRSDRVRERFGNRCWRRDERGRSDAKAT